MKKYTDTELLDYLQYLTSQKKYTGRCELCGNYGYIECNDHCPRCTNRMEELEE